MERTVIFDFDKVFIIRSGEKICSIKEACYGMLPLAKFAPGAEEMIRSCRQKGMRTVLAARGEERIVKESIFVLGACELFDRFCIAETPFLMTEAEMRPAMQLAARFL